MLTFAELVDAIQSRLGRSDKETEIKRAINWAQGFICDNYKVPFLWKQAATADNITTVAGQLAYDLPADFGKADYFRVTYSTNVYYNLTERDRVEITNYQGDITGNPESYALYGYSTSTYRRQVLIGYPAPTAGITVTPFYYARLSDLTIDGSYSVISRLYRDDPLITGAIYKAAYDIEQPELAAAAWSEFQNDIIKMLQTQHTARVTLFKPDNWED